MTAQTAASTVPGPAVHQIEVEVVAHDPGEPHAMVVCATCDITLLDHPASDGTVSLNEVNAAAAAHTGTIPLLPRRYRWAVQEHEITGADDQTLAAWLRTATAAGDTSVRQHILAEITARVRARAAAGPAAPPVPSQGRAAPGTKPAEQVAGREGHVCLACGCRIAQGLQEIRVAGRRGRSRYRHAEDDDCAAAMRHRLPNVALIGRYVAMDVRR